MVGDFTMIDTLRPPAFLRRPPTIPRPDLETGVRDILAKLKANADHEVCEVLAGATNVYSAAIIRFRGNSAFTAKDIDHLITVWQILLDVKREPEADFTSGRPGTIAGTDRETDRDEQ